MIVVFWKLPLFSQINQINKNKLWTKIESKHISFLKYFRDKKNDEYRNELFLCIVYMSVLKYGSIKMLIWLLDLLNCVYTMKSFALGNEKNVYLATIFVTQYLLLFCILYFLYIDEHWEWTWKLLGFSFFQIWLSKLYFEKCVKNQSLTGFETTEKKPKMIGRIPWIIQESPTLC